MSANTKLRNDLQTVGYYPGCALEGSGHAYNRSTKRIAKTLGLKLIEIENWNCCGAMEVKNIDPEVQNYLSVRNMSIAKHKMGLDVVMAPCNGCYHNLKKAEHDVKHREKTRSTLHKMTKKTGEPEYKAGDVETIHALDWIKHAIGEQKISNLVKKSLSGLKIANYYGCMYTRPRHIFPEKDQGESSESTSNPHFMDDILRAAGAQIINFPLKTACCGGAHTLSDCDTSTRLVLNILQAAEACGANVIATECPTCHTGLEMHQIRAEETLNVKTQPVMLYFTQILGLAFGISHRQLGIHENISQSLGLLKQQGVV